MARYIRVAGTAPFRNVSDDIHPLHLHRHSFEVTRVGGKPTKSEGWLHPRRIAIIFAAIALVAAILS
jgi:FtsP/CotA-like multicopper oxidase with cupredoxin domain